MNSVRDDHLAKLSATGLWPSSILRLQAEVGLLDYSRLYAAMENYNKCDDLTLGEIELRDVIKLVCDEYEADWKFD
jgi:hypothetical protein